MSKNSERKLEEKPLYGSQEMPPMRQSDSPHALKTGKLRPTDDSS